MPPAASSRIRTQNSRRACGSKPVVGSSRKSSSGRPITPSATSRRRFWPPDRVWVSARRFSVRPTAVEHGGRVGGIRVVPGEEAHHLLDPQLVELAGALQHEADPAPPVRGRVLRVDAEHADLAGVALPEAFKDLDGRGLPGTVGPEQSEISPLSTARSRPSTACFGPYALRSPRTEIATSVMANTMAHGPVSNFTGRGPVTRQ